MVWYKKKLQATNILLPTCLESLTRRRKKKVEQKSVEQSTSQNKEKCGVAATSNASRETE